MPQQPSLGRHSIRLKGYYYAQAGGYFITITTLWRECLFGEVVDGETLEQSLMNSNRTSL